MQIQGEGWEWGGWGVSLIAQTLDKFLFSVILNVWVCSFFLSLMQTALLTGRDSSVSYLVRVCHVGICDHRETQRHLKVNKKNPRSQ